MGQGSYVIAEWDSVYKTDKNFQEAMADVERRAINKCNLDWAPKTLNLANTFGGGEEEYGRTTILPGAFDDHNGIPMATFRQLFTGTGHMTLMNGVGAGNTIPEDIKLALIGFAFPNKNQHITEIKMQIADRKYGRFDLEEMRIMNKPAIIFEEGLIINEEEAFDLYGYVEGPIPTHIGNFVGVYQRIVPIGALYYKYYNKVGGNVGTAIPTT